MISTFTWIRQQNRILYEGLTRTNGVFSSTKTFASLAYLITSWVVVHQELNGTLSNELILIFLAVVAGHNALMRSPLMKHGKSDAESPKK